MACNTEGGSEGGCSEEGVSWVAAGSGRSPELVLQKLLCSNAGGHPALSPCTLFK